ncbi:MAG: glycosyltransferase family 4 protein [Methanomassiliicoccales archaeon]|nr:MAG: glycosyltransferase family 4 protein [Methanomassiliicoccales archaeon]
MKAILEYASRLSKKGHEVTVICPQPTFANMRLRDRNIPTVLPKRFFMNLLRYKPYWIDVAADIKYVSSWEERHIPDGDVIIATAWQTAPYVKNYSSKKGKKFYLIQHYETLFHASNSETKVEETYRYPLRKIVISSWLKQIMREKFNSEAELLVTPVDFSQFYPTRNGYNKKKRICMLHHFYDWKGANEGIQAFDIARRKYSDIQLVMFGAHLDEVSSRYEYYYSPWGEKLREIYDSCDIFLCPSWKEGLGMPSMEAMACKCALVTMDNGGCSDYAVHEKTALISPPRNPEELAKNLVRFLENEELLRNIARNGYEYIKRFTWDKAVDRIEKVFLKELQEE